MGSNKDVKIKKRFECIVEKSAEIKSLLTGKQATILSDYNGQPFGSSRPSLKGKTITIDSVSISDWGIEVLPDGYRCYLRLSDIKVHW